MPTSPGDGCTLQILRTARSANWRWRDVSPLHVLARSLLLLHADRRQHFAAVRQAIGEADVLVFTLGLTEAWENREDGAIYPVCPGTAAGTFDSGRHRFVNFRMSRIMDDMIKAFDFIRE